MRSQLKLINICTKFNRDPQIFNVSKRAICTKSLSTANYICHTNNANRNPTSLLSPNPYQIVSACQYCKKERISHTELESRVLKVCKDFDKVNAEKLTLECSFTKDLGLDSLDHVEIILAMEDEFFLEIPDEHARRLQTPAEIVRYVADRYDVYD